MSWIKVRTNLHEDPRVIMIAAELGVDELHAVGMLWRAWAWADSQSLDGDELKVTDAFLDRLVRRDGFSAALRKVGWLEGRQGALSFPRFAEHNGQTAKGRALNQQRVANHRARTGVTDSVTPVTHGTLPEERRGEGVANATPPRAREVSQPSGQKPEYIEEQPSSRISPTADSDRPKQTGRSLPPALDTLPFREAWGRWCTYLAECSRSGRGASLMTLEIHLQELEKIGSVLAVQAIDNAISASLRKPCLPFNSGASQKPAPHPVPVKVPCNDNTP